MQRKECHDLAIISLGLNHSIANTSKFTQRYKVVPYYYAVYWLPLASSTFSFARKCNGLAGNCVMRRAWAHKFKSSGPTVSSLYCDLNPVDSFWCVLSRARSPEFKIIYLIVLVQSDIKHKILHKNIEKRELEAIF